ncbi:hypothetical protein IV500_02495 [Paeniglutamicibacter antarcticus]|uniref:Lipoprotein n=1 Tax=Arthrobacter terrae TaxID=2935737 RepID=A0A931CNY0_9MICC|nr:hypothetical protein [Arthrobacter terrae]MBG0738301.1 hypothetical protein [Arthrobacter terrae]
MNQRQKRPIRLVALILTVFLLPVAACSGTPGALSRLSSAMDDAGRLVSRAADASELSGASTTLEDILKTAPKGSALNEGERAIVESARQRSAALTEIAGMLGVADEVKGLISADSVTLLRGAFLRQPSEAMQRTMEAAGKAIGKESACAAFANGMDASSPSRTAQSPSAAGIYLDLTQAVSDAGYNITEVQRVVDLHGLSSRMLSAAGQYVGKVKKTMTAAAWNNGGAFQAYLRICVT